MIATGYITAPRPRSTLFDSIKSYRRAGFDNQVFVFAEPGAEEVIDDTVTYLRNETKLGNLRNWHRALAVLAKQDADWILICEDDVSWASGAAALLSEDLDRIARTNLVREAGMLSLYLPRRHTRQFLSPLAPGWYALGRGPGTWGFQATLFSRSQALSLLGDASFKRYLDNPALDKNVDKFVGTVIAQRGKTILYRVPCLVDHDLGDANSSLGYRDDRPDLRTDYFRGPRA